MTTPRHFLADAARMRVSTKFSTLVDMSAPACYEVRAVQANTKRNGQSQHCTDKWFGQFRRVGWPHWLTVTRNGRENIRFETQEGAVSAAQRWLDARGLRRVS
jgi:hypothetical protein